MIVSTDPQSINVVVGAPDTKGLIITPTQPTMVTAPVGMQGPPGTIDVVELTQGEYTDLAEKVPTTIYVIT